MKKIYAAFLIFTFLAFPVQPTPVYAATDIINDATLGANVVSCWELDEASGTRADTVTASGNDLTDVNTVGQTTGVVDDAARFDDTSSEYLRITDASQTGLGVTGDFTMAMWVRLPNGNTGQQAFMSKNNSSGNQRSYFLYKESANDIRMLMSSNGSYQASGNPVRSYTYPTNTWFHLGFVYDASAGEGKFYVNGSQQGTTVTGMPTSVYDGTADFAIGGSHGGIYTSDDIDIDVAAFFAAELTDADMSSLYASGFGIPCDAGGAAPARRIIRTTQF